MPSATLSVTAVVQARQDANVATQVAVMDSGCARAHRRNVAWATRRRAWMEAGNAKLAAAVDVNSIIISRAATTAIRVIGHVTNMPEILTA